MVTVRNQTPQPEHTPRFQPDHAFVIQFSSLAGNAGFESGRVEHVVTGRAQTFDDERALLSFMAAMLASVESHEEEPVSGVA